MSKDPKVKGTHHALSISLGVVLRVKGHMCITAVPFSIPSLANPVYLLSFNVTNFAPSQSALVRMAS